MLKKYDSVTQFSVFLWHSHVSCSETSEEDEIETEQLVVNVEMTEDNVVDLIYKCIFAIILQKKYLKLVFFHRY